jgi:uncharacterized protein YjbJ (UPF0337 family)
MNQDQAGGKWKQFKGKIKEQWGKLTDDDLTMIEGNRDSSSAAYRSVMASRRKRPSASSVSFRTGTRISPGSRLEPFGSTRLTAERPQQSGR